MPRRPLTPFFFTAALGALVLAAITSAQPAPPDPKLTPITPGAAAEHPVVVDQVMLVASPAEYVRAIGAWTPAQRYPVLIDDGTYGAQQNIARFVRAFKPAHVVRPAAVKAGERVLPDVSNPDLLTTEIQSALQHAWGAPDERALHDLWRATKSLPAGVVVYDPRDAAWTGALALAAGRGQLLIRFDKPASWGRIDETIPLAEAAKLVALTNATFKLWMPDQTRATAMRAVTLCLNAPVRVQLAGGESLPGMGPLVCKPGEPVALCDLLGRFTKPGDTTGAGIGVSRWAVGGQMFGNHAESAYRAMCGLFLDTRTAFVFDGYSAGRGFDDYDGTRAAQTLKTGGYTVEVHDRPDNRPSDWRSATARPIDAGLVLVNSHGNRDVFNLADQPATCGDIPELQRPAVVSVVHSWSAVSPADRWTVAGRWFERGAYAYVGSVHEPYLAAFVPTPRVAENIIEGKPLGAAVRMDAPPWRVALLGDPLIVLKPEAKSAPRAASDTMFLTDLETDLRDRLQARNFGEAMVTLVLLGRDKDAARLASALLRDQPAEVTMGVAQSAIGAAHRAGDLDTFFALLKVVQPSLTWRYESGPLDVPDMAWHAAMQLGLTLSDDRVDLMTNFIRPGGGDQSLRDALELYRVVEARKGAPAAKVFLQKIADTTQIPGAGKQIAERLRTL